MLPRLEAQIERFAPGFASVVLARYFLTRRLEVMDANLVGGDIAGGAWICDSFCFGRPGGTTRLRRETVYLFGVNPAGRRRARHVRLSRGQSGAVKIGTRIEPGRRE